MREKGEKVEMGDKRSLSLSLSLSLSKIGL